MIMRRLLSLFFAVALLVTACSKPEPDNPTPDTPKQETVTLSPGTNTAPVIATAGGSTNVSFTASASWSASIINTKADSWCSVAPTSGVAGAATITITVKENATPDNRSASVVIKVGTATQTIKVEQKQKDALTVTASSFEVPADGGQIKVATKSNVSFTHTISTDAQSWITAVETKALKDSTLTFEISANDKVANRSGQIYLASGNLKDTVNVYQAGETPTVVVSQDEYVLKSEGESFEVEVASNVNATMSMVYPQGVEAWITENTTRTVSTNKFYFTAQANETYDSRSALLIFTNAENNLADTVTVTQAQKDAIVVAKSSYNVENAGGAIEIEVGHNVDYEYTISADWITKAETKAMVTDKLVFNIAENTSYDNREGAITFTAGDLKQEVKVYQSEKGALIISKKDYVINDAGGEITMEIQSNVEFSVTAPSVDWLHDITTKGLQTHTLKYQVDANGTYDSRSTQIYVNNLKTGSQDTLTITQTQKDAIVLAKSEYEFDSEGGSLDFEIQTNVDVTVTIPDSCFTWIKQVETRGLETKKLYFDILPTDSVSREGAIVLTGGNITQTVKIVQSCTVEIDPSTIPDNEIWYTTTDRMPISLNAQLSGWPNAEFNTNVVFNGYRNGKGVIEFDGPVNKIGKMSFAEKDNLVSIYLPGSVNYIGLNAFINCDYLTEVTINSGYLQIEREYTSANPFKMCSNLQKFIGPLASEDGRCLIVNNTLYSFAPYGITEYTIPQGVTTIEDSSFEQSNLKVITIPEGVERIEAHAFAATSFTDYHIESSLEYVYLPSTLKYINGYAFQLQKNIKAFYGENEFVSPDGKCLVVDNYDQSGNKSLILFASGAGLTEYTIPEGVETIESYAFYYATSLKKLNFPDSFKQIYSGHAFEGTTNIETITGKYVQDDKRSMVIDEMLVMYAGAGQEKYTTPKGVKSIGYQALGFNNDIKEYVISDDVTQAGGYGYLFNQCPNLETVTLSARMKYLGYDPFGSEWWSTPKIKTVYCRAIIPPIVYNNPGDERYNFEDLTIFVPEQFIDAYKNSNYWIKYRDYIKGYSYTDLPEIDFYISSDYTQDGEVTILQTATKGDGIDIVLMGDAYSDRQVADGTYKADMETIYNNLFTEEPYKSFKDHFNVYYVNVVSATEGYEHSGTALGGFFGGGTLVGGDDNTVFQYALKAISEEEMDEALLIVAMNSDNYAGTCYMYYPQSNGSDYGTGVSVSYFPKGGDAETFAQLLHHEACGHGFAKLADEYAYEDYGNVPDDYVTQIREQQSNWGWWKNVDFTSDSTQVRWKKFLDDTRYANDGLGIFEGGLTYWSGVWRPTENSIMRYNTGGFNAPSREAIYYRIHKLAYGAEWVYDYEKFVEYDAVNRKTSAAVSTKSPSVVQYRPLHPPVVHNKSWRDAKKEN